MSVIIIASILIAINLIMWIVFAARFKKIFTTDDIMAQTRAELNGMLSEINNNADRNVELIDERIRQLKAVIGKADRELRVLRGELEKVENSAAFQEKLNEANAVLTKQTHHKKRTIADLDSLQGSLFMTDKGKEEVSLMHAQMELPIERPNPYERYQKNIPPSASSGADTVKAADHALAAAIQAADQIPAIQRIPVVTPNAYLADIPVKSKKSFAEHVRELHALG